MKLQELAVGGDQGGKARQYEPNRKDETIITNFMFMIMVLCWQTSNTELKKGAKRAELNESHDVRKFNAS
jgi:hypothetical protein